MSESPQEQMKRFAQQSNAKNTEIFDNLLALRGHFRAVAASEIANLTLAARMATIVEQDAIAIYIAESLAVFVHGLVEHHGWDGQEFMKEVDAFITVRYQQVRMK